MAEFPEQLESALVSWLITQPFPDSLKNFDGAFRIFSGESESLKDGQTIIASAGAELTEEPLYSGNYWAEATVQLITPVITPAPGSADPTSLSTHQAAAAILKLAVTSASIASDIASSVTGLTVYGVTDRHPVREQTEDTHMSGFKLRIYACPSPQ
jgi:hypothetical protein